MDSSVQAYIEEKSTEFLFIFVKQCINGFYKNDYDYILPYVLRVLVNRKDFHELALKELLSMKQESS